MKNILLKIAGIRFLLIILLWIITMNACTDKFESFNTNPSGVTNEMLQSDFNFIGGFYPSIQRQISNESYVPDNSVVRDLGQYLVSGMFTGYFCSANPAVRYGMYDLFSGWDSYHQWNRGYNGVMSQIKEIERRGARSLAKDYWGVALTVKVAMMSKITDEYGPIPYSKFGQGGSSVAYDNQKQIYDVFFAELDTAVINLKSFIAANPSASPFKKFDLVYNGDYTKWLKLANSLRLRLAMHIVKVDPLLAKTQAEKAMDQANGGVLTSNSDNAIVADPTINVLSMIMLEWGDVRLNASLVSYLNSYKDPRLSKWFSPSKTFPDKFIGLRMGRKGANKAEGIALSSSLNSQTFSRATPSQIMNSSEVYFLRAEGKLRGWNMGNETAQQLYELAVNKSFEQWGLGSASAYLTDNTSKQIDYVDPLYSENNYPAVSTITIKWDESDSNEQKLERIITQKWIAIYPDCDEAWANFRRTGYPKLFPVASNQSQGKISTEIQIRRMTYPLTEYINNASEIAKGVALLGGPDFGGTRLWWDIDKGNF